MNAFVRWSAILSLAGSAMLAPAMSRQMSALALPEKQVMDILGPVPLFMITNQDGQPLAATITNPQDKKQVQVYSFFVSQQDAQQVLNTLRTNRPEVGKVAKITPASLSGVVKLAMDSQKQPNANVGVDIVPSKAQLDAAVAMLRQNGDIVDKGGQLVTKDGKPFQGGTPLFFVADSKTRGPLALEANYKENGQDKKVQFVPFYFSKQEVQAQFDQASKQSPELAKTSRIDVVMLDTLLSTLLSSNEPAVGQFQLVPPRESIDFIRQQAPSAQPGAPRPAGAGSGTPRPAPAAAPKPGTN